MINLTKYIPKLSPGFVVEILNNKKIIKNVIGNKCIFPSIEPLTEDTLYDIASLTKLYTVVLIYIAYEEKKIDINDYVYNIDSKFVNLKEIKIIDLLSHNQNIWTKGYLGNSKSKKEFYEILYSAYVKENIPTYVDTHYIILSYLLEKIYNKSFDKICEEKIIEKLELKNTTFKPDKNNTASNNYEHNGDKIIDNIYPGLIHDTKARVASELGIVTGHASIFTTADDLMIFLNTFLNCKLLKKETIDFMLKHRDTNLNNYNYLSKYSSYTDINKMYVNVTDDIKSKLSKTYNNMGTRYKNDIEELNDVPVNSSDKTITFSGFTGPMFVIDFSKKIIIIVMCNIIHNTYLNRNERKKLLVKIINDIYDSL